MAKVAQASTRSIVIGVREIEKLAAQVAASRDEDVRKFLDAIGQQQEDSARRRIAETKTSPDGQKWPSWSKKYAKTRGAGKSLLRNEGALADTMTHVVEGRDAVEIGSNMVYAASHLYGDAERGIPQRAFLDTEPGFSDSRDREEIRDIARAFMDGLI